MNFISISCREGMPVLRMCCWIPAEARLVCCFASVRQLSGAGMERRRAGDAGEVIPMEYRKQLKKPLCGDRKPVSEEGLYFRFPRISLRTDIYAIPLFPQNMGRQYHGIFLIKFQFQYTVVPFSVMCDPDIFDTDFTLCQKRSNICQCA